MKIKFNHKNFVHLVGLCTIAKWCTVHTMSDFLELVTWDLGYIDIVGMVWKASPSVLQLNVIRIDWGLHVVLFMEQTLHVQTAVSIVIKCVKLLFGIWEIDFGVVYWLLKRLVPPLVLKRQCCSSDMLSCFTLQKYIQVNIMATSLLE